MIRAEERQSATPGLLAVMWKSIGLIIVLTLGAGLVGFVVAKLQTEQYLGSVRLHMSYPDEGSDAPRDPQRRLNDLAARVSTTPVLERAAQKLGANAPSVQELTMNVSAQPSESVDIIDIQVRDASAERAVRIANEVAAAFQEVASNARVAAAQAAVENVDRIRSEIQSKVGSTNQRLNEIRAGLEAEVNKSADPAPPNLRAQALDVRLESDTEYLAALAERDAALNQLRDLTSRTQEITLDAAATGSGVDLVEPASVSDDPVSPKPLRSALLGGVVGLLVAVSLAWLREMKQAPAPRGSTFGQASRPPHQAPARLESDADS